MKICTANGFSTASTARRCCFGNGDPVGLLEIARDAGLWTIVRTQLAPEQQGWGMDSALLREILAEADAAGVPVTLSVLRANPARALYARLGFVVVE